MLILNKAITVGLNSIFNNFNWNTVYGVDYYANIFDDNGMAHIARAIHKALIEANVPITVSQFSSLTKYRIPPNRYPVNIILGGAENTMITSIFNNIPKDEYTIGIWFWELEDYFPWEEAYDYVDEIWCFSQFCYDIFNKFNHRGLPIFKLTYAPETNMVVGSSIDVIERKYNIRFNKFTFLCTFDYFGSINRKNPFGVVDAFINAFGNNNNVQLVIKTMSGGGFAHDKSFFENYIKDYKNIICIDNVMDKRDYVGLMNACDCYVSLHRSEGLGIGMIEAMYFGKPVIATAYGGSMEFMDPSCAMLVKYKKNSTMTNLCNYHPDALWADPDIENAAFYMKLLFNNRDYCKVIGDNAKKHVLLNFNQTILNSQVSSRLNQIKRII
jgi:glycosyltransferase involved in cell wall biosynthesis